MKQRAEDSFHPHLAAGEAVRWSGQPRQGVVFHGLDIVMIPLSLVWAGVALLGFGVAAFPSDGGSWLALLFTLPFVGVAIYITVGRFWLDRQQRARTVYAVTDERVLIRSGVFRPTTKSLDLRTVSDITLTERRGGRGTITFGPSLFPAFFQSMAWAQGGIGAAPAFDTIDDASSVYRLILDLQRPARS